MPSYYCIECGRPTRHLNIKAAAEHCEVTRATIYNWIKRGLIHCVLQPSGRKFICTESLLVPGFSIYQSSWDDESRWRDEGASPRPAMMHAAPLSRVGSARG